MSKVRDKLIEATFHEVFTNGYNAASLVNILNRAEVKKGAMYHYFPSKKAMVLAMIEETIEERIEKKWISLSKSENNTLDMIIEILSNKEKWDLDNGCPLGNLLQESLNKDEDFSFALNTILNKWKELFIKIFEKAKENNEIKQEVNIDQCATFIIALIEGAILLAKKPNDNQNFYDCISQLDYYLNSLKIKGNINE